MPRFVVYPASNYVTPKDDVMRAIESIKEELRDRVEFFQKEGKVVEAQRLQQRTLFDLEMLQEVGFCKGIENYTRHLSGLKPGEPPACLLDYFPADSIMFFDESHVTMGQIGGMYRGNSHGKRRSLNTASAFPQHSITGRSGLMSLSIRCAVRSLSRPLPRSGSSSTRLRWWSRWCVRLGFWIRRLKCGPRRPR